MAPHDPQTVGEGRYQFHGPGEAGEAATAQERAGFDRLLHRHVTLTVYDDEGDRWLREVQARDRVDHVTVASVLDGGPGFVVLEADPGEALLDRVAREPLGADDAVATVLTLAHGLGHMHERGVAHGDVGAHAVRIDPVTGPHWSRFGRATTVDCRFR